MSGQAKCPFCSGSSLSRHGSRPVDVTPVEGGRLRWGRASVERMLCRSCGKTHGAGAAEVEAMAKVARAFVCDVYARRGMEEAVAVSGLTDRTVERWVRLVVDERLADPLPNGILLSVLGRQVLISNAADGRPLDAAPGDANEVAGLLGRRGGDVEVAWIWPSMLLKEAVGRAFPDAEVRIPRSVACGWLDRLLATLDVPGGPCEARLLSARVTASGWHESGLASLAGLYRARGGSGDAFLALWRDEILSGLKEADPVRPSFSLPEEPLSRLRAAISAESSSSFAREDRRMRKT